MAEIEITLSETASPRTMPAQRVYTKALWADEWELREHLWCTSCTAVAAPQLPAAQLVWRFGRGIQFGAAGFAQIPRLEFVGFYVKIEIDSDVENEPVRWYGLITAVQEVRLGRLGGTAEGSSIGKLIFSCLGLEYLLARTPLNTSYVDPVDQTRIDRALPFNGATETANGSNRSDEPVTTDGVYVFSSSATFAWLWTTYQMVRYLLTRQGPTDRDGETKIPIELDPESADLLAEFEEPRISCEGKTLKAVLDQLLDRRRLLSYSLNVVPGEEEGDPEIIQLRAFRFNDVEIEGEGVTIPPNPRLVTLNVDDSLDPLETRLSSDGTQQFDQVIARGQPIMCCFSVSFQDNTLRKAWSTTQETDYNDGASGEGDYPTADERDARCRRNRDWRAHDRLERVYSYFSLPNTFQGFVGDGEGGDTNPYLPSEEDDTEPVPYRVVGWRVSPRLPLKTDHDYSGTKIATESIDDATPSEQPIEYRQPFVVFPLNDPETLDATERWQFGHKLASNCDTPGTGMGAGRRWSVSLRPQDFGPGFVLQVSGAPQHAIADGIFTAPDDSEDEQLGALDYQEMIATIAIAADKRLESKWPLEGILEADTLKTLVIEVPECCQHYVAPGTVVGIRDGVLQRTTSGGTIRDDSERLLRIATIAANWYTVRRQVFHSRLKRITNQLRIGDLITAIGPADDRQVVRTPVTFLSWEMDEATGDQLPPTMTTSIDTGFAELDPNSL